MVGASGFLGQHVVGALEGAGHRVVGTSLSGGHGTVVYALGEPLPPEIGVFAPEAVVDLAWEGIPDFSLERCRANVDGQAALIDEVVAIESVRRLVIAGTCREYGDAVGLAMGLAIPVDDFGRAKDEVHRLAIERCKRSDIALTWFRIFYVYGPGQRSGSLLPSVIADLASAGEPRVRDRAVAHDFVEVSDVAEAFVCSLESSGRHDVLDLGSGILVDVGTVVDLATRISRGEEPLTGLAGERAVADRRSIHADVARTSSVLGWRPFVRLEAGIRQMVEAVGSGDARLRCASGDERGTMR